MIPLMPSKLGVPELDDVWRAIDYEVVWLHGRWAIYRQLYGTSEARVDILNRSAGTFSRMLQDVLLDDVQLGLAKLGDPATSRIRGATVQNMTLPNLCQLVIATGALAAELPSLLAAYDAACIETRERRNKRIAHFDLATMLASTVPLRAPSRAKIETALDALRCVMNRISLHFTGTQTAYDLIVLDNDGSSLIATLKRGIRYRELVAAGTIPSDDLAKSSLGKA